jgi:hypothetical protein
LSHAPIRKSYRVAKPKICLMRGPTTASSRLAPLSRREQLARNEDALGAAMTLRLFTPAIGIPAHDSHAQSNSPATPSRKGLGGQVAARHPLPRQLEEMNAMTAGEARPDNRSRAVGQARADGGDLWGGDERSSGVGAGGALRQLARCGCLNAAPPRRVVSSAARTQSEHRSAVAACGRPPHCEPSPASACRAAPRVTMASDPRT